jgi:DNA repair protein SbcC/Rad50
VQQQDDELWQQFQQASAIAYAPCKEFFEVQAAERENNLGKRRELVSQLQQYLQGYDFSNAVWKDVEQTLKTARAEWQTYWPVPRKAGNDLQKEFENLMEQLFGKITSEYESNKTAKQHLIEQAQILVDSSDARAATETIKQLQAQWKTIGKSWHKEDQQLWQEFRKHCDAVFALRNQAFEAVKEQRQAIATQAEQLISQLQLFGSQSLEQLNSAKAEIESLKTEFMGLDLPKESAKELQKKFNDSLTTIAAKRTNARAQAEEQSWTDLFSALDAVRHYELAVIANTPSDQLIAQKAAVETLIANTPRWPSGCLNAIQQRLNKAGDITSDEQSNNQELLRTLAIRAEILTGITTPDEDKQVRMAYQVKQMQESFGQRDSNFDPLILEWVGTGAVADAIYSPLFMRFNTCRQQGTKQ